MNDEEWYSGVIQREHSLFMRHAGEEGSEIYRRPKNLFTKLYSGMQQLKFIRENSVIKKRLDIDVSPPGNGSLTCRVATCNLSTQPVRDSMKQSRTLWQQTWAEAEELRLHEAGFFRAKASASAFKIFGSLASASSFSKASASWFTKASTFQPIAFGSLQIAWLWLRLYNQGFGF